jgi:DNA-binding GntR family transcriptional regulator
MSNQLLSEQVYTHIYDRIVRQEMLPGDLIDRRQIAAELKVSVSPVVQAISRLEMEGIVEILPRKVTRVRIVRIEDFEAQILLRAAVESHAARFYCGQPIRDHESRLMTAARKMDEKSRSLAIDWRAEIDFHRELIRLIDHPRFLQEYDRVVRAGYFIRISKSGTPVVPEITDGLTHVDLIQALKKGDPDLASRITREHIECGKDAYLDEIGNRRLEASSGSGNGVSRR